MCIVLLLALLKAKELAPTMVVFIRHRLGYSLECGATSEPQPEPVCTGDAPQEGENDEPPIAPQDGENIEPPVPDRVETPE